MAEIDTLEVKIKANATNAAQALNSLATALNNVKKALSATKGDASKGIAATQKLSQSINDIHNAIARVSNDDIKKLQSLSNALNSYGKGLQRIGGPGNIPPWGGGGNGGNGGGGGGNNGGANNTPTPFDDFNDKVKRYKDSMSGLGNSIDDLTKKFNNLGKSVNKAGRSTSQAGKNAKKADGMFKKLGKSILRIAMYRAIRSAMKAVAEAFSEGLKNAYLFSRQSENFTSLADTLDRLKSSTSQMVNQLGALAGEIVELVAPALEWLIEKIRLVAEKLTELFAALNGKDKYMFAKYEQKRWDEATEAVKKYKHQLLGLDELNNLSGDKEDDSDKEKTPAYELKEVSANVAGIAKGIKDVFGWIGDAFGGIADLVVSPIGMVAIGALLIFTNHPLIGLGLVLGGAKWTYDEVTEDWDGLRGKVERAFEDYAGLFAGVAVGTVAIGALLLFTQHYIAGISLILAGTGLAARTLPFAWDDLRKTVKKNFKKYKKLFNYTGAAAAVGAVAVGALLLFTQNYVAGIALILAGTGIGAATIAFNWDSLLLGIQTAFENVLNWLKDTFIPKFDKVKEYIQNPLGEEGFDFGTNPQTLPAYQRVKLPSDTLQKIGQVIVGIGVLVGAGAGGGGKYFEKNLGLDGTFASGGIPKSGSLFVAGEAGAGTEFVGNLGTSSAVANTQQMTDAIYKAAYMGMSRALQENGGMGGFEPATTDDLFIAMRKKASKYNKRTGNSAFA